MPFFDHYPYTNFHNINLDWVLQAVKSWGALVEQNNQNFINLNAANEAFKAYINNHIAEYERYVTGYITNLDVQEEINNKLDELLESGTLSPYMRPYIVSEVESWLTEHVTPTTPAVDNTLTISGAAAESSEVGARFDDVNSSLNIVGSESNYVFPQKLSGYCVEGYAYSATGQYQNNAGIICTSKFLLKSNTVTCGSYINLYALFDSKWNFLERVTVSPPQKTISISNSNAKYIALMFNKNNTSLIAAEASYIRGVYIDNNPITLEVGYGREYTTVLAAFQFAEKITDRKVIINIYEGDYDIYDELGGGTFVASISSSATWCSGIQPVFTGDVEINGIGNVILRMEIPNNIYTQYTYQATRLSQINNSGSIKISNITFISKNNRYAIHDECDNNTNYASTTHEYIDCRFYCVNGSAAIGIGASSLSNYLLKNCYLKNSTASVFYLHNWSNTRKGNLVVVDSVLENGNVNGNGIRLGANSNYLFDIFVSSSYLHNLKVTSENASTYSTNRYRIICNNTNLSSAIIDESIVSSTYDAVFKNW